MLFAIERANYKGEEDCSDRFEVMAPILFFASSIQLGLSSTLLLMCNVSKDIYQWALRARSSLQERTGGENRRVTITQSASTLCP